MLSPGQLNSQRRQLLKLMLRELLGGNLEGGFVYYYLHIFVMTKLGDG
jgi:hypothetical protein